MALYLGFTPSKPQQKERWALSSHSATSTSFTSTFQVVVPRASVGMIIGKGGETIKRLAMETGTKIQFKADGK